MFLTYGLITIGVFFIGRTIYRYVAARRWMKECADGNYNPLRRTYQNAHTRALEDPSIRRIQITKGV